MRQHKILAMLTVMLTVSACTTPAPTYRNPTPAPTDAEISFESDFTLHTHFSINTEQNSKCGKYETVGYLLKADSAFIYDKPNYEIKVTVPTGKPIGVAGYHSFQDPGYKANCFPKGHSFTPLPGEKYVVKMNKISQGMDAKGNEKGICYISIENIGLVGERKQVALNSPPNCTQ